MAGMGITTKRGNTREALVGMGDVLDKLTQLAETCGDLRPAWDELGQMWERRQNTWFTSHGAGSWRGFARTTTLRDHQPLINTGVMEQGMTLARPRYDDQKMVAFGPIKYDREVMSPAILNTVGHSSGNRWVNTRGTVGTGHVPPRMVVPPLSSSERKRWIEVIDRYIMEATNQ